MPLSAPLLFEPFLRPMPWGGDRLRDWVRPGAEQEWPPPPIGEAWLISDHALHRSRVAAGPAAGRTLAELLAEDAAGLLGAVKLDRAGRFPLLVKLLDARANLSVQVHPNDAQAQKWAPHEGGKTEAWHVLEADANSAIYLGVKPGIDAAMLAREITGSNLPLCLRRYDPRPGETYFVPAGSIHALTQGLVVLEVQQTSDATFRLHDWGRVDAHGNPRPLHLEAGSNCLDLMARTQVLPPLAASAPRIKCPYFSLQQVVGPVDARVPTPALVFVAQGDGGELIAGGQAVNMGRGRLAMVPAAAVEARLTLPSTRDLALVIGFVGNAPAAI